MNARKILLFGIFLTFLDVGVPYLFLRDIARFWASYLYWVLITAITIVFGIISVQNWGDIT